MPGYDSGPAPSLHLNCTGKLTILPEIPHSSALNNTTQSPLNQHIACLLAAEQTPTCTTSCSDFAQVCMNMFDPGFQRGTAVSRGASHMGRQPWDNGVELGLCLVHSTSSGKQNHRSLKTS